jgi:ATP adenylyltransferase
MRRMNPQTTMAGPWHVVPRWEGDTNFMPVLGEVRVLPESLDATFRILKDAFAAEGAGR